MLKKGDIASLRRFLLVELCQVFWSLLAYILLHELWSSPLFLYPSISSGELQSCALMTDMFPADYSVSVSFLTLLIIDVAERSRIDLILSVVGVEDGRKLSFLGLQGCYSDDSECRLGGLVPT